MIDATIAPRVGFISPFDTIVGNVNHINGKFQPLPEAGVTEQRTLEAVGWKPVLAALSPEQVERQNILLTMIRICWP
jgi:hypothetical protein